MLHKELNQEVKTKVSDQHLDQEVEAEAELAEEEVIRKARYPTIKYKDKICEHKTLSNQWTQVTFQVEDNKIKDKVHQLIIHKA